MKLNVDQMDSVALEPNSLYIINDNSISTGKIYANSSINAEEIYAKDFIIIKDDGTKISLGDVILTTELKNNKMKIIYGED